MEDPESWPTGRLLSTAARMLETEWARRLDELGLTHAGLIALHLLDGDARSQTGLARAAGVELQTIVRTLDRLERHALVSRHRDPADARRVLVERTPAGDAIRRTAEGLGAEVLPHLSAPEALRAQLLEIVRSVARDRDAG